MKWIDHSYLKNKHAFLGASQYHWLNYDEEKLIKIWSAEQAKRKGTRLHAWAAEAIELGQKLPKSQKTINMYVNDAIGYRMKPEQLLMYSPNVFGTADAISFRKNELRIHDLKTGEIPAHMEQLEIYAALFCLEYDYNPSDISIELRIYQNNQIIYENPELDVIAPIMDKIVSFDKLISKLQEEGEL